MKSKTRLFVFPLLILFLILNSGCDQFEFINSNLKITEQIQAVGDDNIYEETFFCLTDYDGFNDNIDSIEEMEYVAAAYFTDTASVGLVGQKINASVFRDDTDELIFSVDLPTAIAADYYREPYKIALTPDEVTRMNQYLTEIKANPKNSCFKATLYVESAQDEDGPPFFLTGRIELVVKLKIKP
jgi:hypothetical protein